MATNDDFGSVACGQSRKKVYTCGAIAEIFLSSLEEENSKGDNRFVDLTRSIARRQMISSPSMAKIENASKGDAIFDDLFERTAEESLRSNQFIKAVFNLVRSHMYHYLLFRKRKTVFVVVKGVYRPERLNISGIGRDLKERKTTTRTQPLTLPTPEDLPNSS